MKLGPPMRVGADERTRRFDTHGRDAFGFACALTQRDHAMVLHEHDLGQFVIDIQMVQDGVANGMGQLEAGVGVGYVGRGRAADHDLVGEETVGDRCLCILRAEDGVDGNGWVWAMKLAWPSVRQSA